MTLRKRFNYCIWNHSCIFYDYMKLAEANVFIVVVCHLS